MLIIVWYNYVFTVVCPEKCKCSKNSLRKHIDCRKQNLQHVPVNFPAGTTHIWLPRNNISHLKADDFAGCTQLNFLDLSNNKIDKIDNGTFVDCVSLAVLKLCINNIDIDELNNEVFEGLSGLQRLMIDHNKRQNASGSYRGELYNTMTNLVHLQLDGLPDVVFPQEFSRLRKLKELTVFNGLTAIRNDTFAAFAGCPITQLDINTRKHLRTLEPMSFAHFHELKELDLSYNRNLGFENASIAWYGLRFTKIQTIILTSITPDNERPSTINAAFFNHLNETKLNSLFLDRNDLIRIDPHFSDNLPYLLYLQLKENRLADVGSLIEDCAKLKRIKKIDVSYQINPSLAVHLSNKNYYDIIEDETSINIAGDAHYSLYSYRDGKKYPILPCKTETSLRSCPRVSVAADPWQTTDDLPGKNFLQDLDPVCVRVAPSLESVDLTEAIRVPMHTLAQTIIFGGKSFKHLVLNGNGLERIVGPIIFTEAPSRLAVYLSNNRIFCLSPGVLNISASNGSAIDIAWLILSNNQLGDQLDKDAHGRTFQFYKHLKRLNLNNNGIKNLTRHVFDGIPDIEELRLSQNSLRQITFKYDHMRNLSFLDLSFNLFSTLNDSVIDAWSAVFDRNGSNFTISMNGNPLQCSCETLRFLYWMDKYRKHFRNFEKYTCLYKAEYVTFTRLPDYILIDLQFDCSKRIAVIVSGILVGFILLLLTTSVIFYRHRWEIRYACLKLTQRGQRYQELVELEVEYEYDAFIVYDSEDRQWVNDEMVPHLEQLELHSLNLNEDYPAPYHTELPRSLRLCVHERDFPPGQQIVANIWQRMERSRKVVVVISKNFAMSDYCDYEVNLGRMLSVEKGRNVLVPVLLELPDVHNVSECLNWVMRKLTYIQWPQHEGDHEDFWQKLREAIGSDIDGSLFRQP